MLRACTFAVLFAALFGLAACSGEPVDPEGRIILKLWKHQAGEVEEAAAKEAIARFNASQTQWRIEAQSLPQSNYPQSLVASSLAGQMPCILTVDSPMVASFAWAGHIRPIENLVPASEITDLSQGAVGRYDGHIYSLGQFDASLAIFARKSELDRLGIRIPALDQPWTLDEFDAALAAFKQDGSYNYPLDLATRDLSSDWWTYAFSPMLQSAGGDLINRDNLVSAEGKLNGDEALRFARWFRSLFERGLVNRREPDDNAFVAGRAALAYTGNWWEPTFREQFDDDLAILPPPDFGNGPKVGTGSWQWAISRTCDHPEGAAAFLSFMVQPSEIAAVSDATGLIPTSVEAASMTRDYGPDGQNRIFFEMLEKFGTPRPSTPAFQVISSSWQRSMRAVMEGQDARDALDDAVDEIETAIRDTAGFAPDGGEK